MHKIEFEREDSRRSSSNLPVLHCQHLPCLAALVVYWLTLSKVFKDILDAHINSPEQISDISINSTLTSGADPLISMTPSPGDCATLSRQTFSQLKQILTVGSLVVR